MEEKNKYTLVLGIIGISISILLAIGISYAYFSADTTGNTGNVDVNVETAKKRDVFSTSGETTISLDVTSDKMQYADKGSVAVSDSKTISVSLEAGSGKATCTYDLTYIPDESFVGSGLDNELTLEGSNGSKTFGPIDIKGSSNVNLGSFKITDEYENPGVVTTETWTLIGKFNNLDDDQNNSVNKTFSGVVKATNVVCENSLEEEESKIQILNDGDIDTIGTEVAIGDEHFYVISSDTDSVTMLAEYNLLVGYKDGYIRTEEFSTTDEGYNLQSSEARGRYLTGPFSHVEVGTIYFSSSYWRDGSSLKPEYGTSYPAYVYDDNASIKKYVDNYKDILEDEYSATIEEARLIKYEELVNLGCDLSKYTCITDTVTNNNRQWIYNTSYWSGSADSAYYVVTIGSDGGFGSRYIYDDDCEGVRPVITISKDLFE